MQDAPEPPLDEAVLGGLRELVGDGPALLDELVGLFVEDTKERLSVLGGAVAGADAEAVRRTAHTIKGSSGNMGARWMRELSGALEEAGTARDLERASDLLGRIEEEFVRVRRALEEEMGEPRA